MSGKTVSVSTLPVKQHTPKEGGGKFPQRRGEIPPKKGERGNVPPKKGERGNITPKRGGKGKRGKGT